MEIQAMAAQYTAMTIEEWDTFLRRGFRALRPKQGFEYHEYIYDLHLSEKVSIRIWTSVSRDEVAKRVGADIIKLLLYSPVLKRPLMKKANVLKAKRTQGWRDTVRDRIEDLIELYEKEESYWESRENSPNRPPSGARPPYGREQQNEDEDPY